VTYQVLARKYRPATFDEVVGQDAITRTLRNALASGRIAHAYLFAGPRGIGKTTTARLLARALLCPERKGADPCGACPACQDAEAGIDIIEIDAASNRKIEDIRTLRENVKYAPAHGRYKVYIIDEVHQLTNDAFDALLKTLEEPPPHVVMVLATTDPRELPPTILSRVQRFDFRPMTPDLLTTTLESILGREKLEFDPAALPAIVRAAEGSLRDALSLLDTAIAYGNGRLDAETTATLLGTTTPAEVRAFAAALVAHDVTPALEAIDRAAREGEDLGAFTRDVIELLRRALVLKAAPAAKLADVPHAEANELRALGEAASLDGLLYVLRAFLDADGEMRRSPHPRVELEIAAVRATRRPQPQAIETLITKLEEAEARLRQMPTPTGGSAPARPVVVQTTLLDARPAPGVSPPPRPAATPSPGSVSASASTPASTSAHAAASAASAPVPSAPARSSRPSEDEPLVETAAADIEAAAAIPVSASSLDTAWERVVTDLMKRKALLGSVLQHATPLRVEDGVLTLALQASGFHREMLNDRGNKELINEAVQRHVASARRFELDPNGVARAGGGGARNHPAVQAALSAFQGEVVAVRPRTPEEGESR
jgi:DNA polymerase III subunit gamma/tau